jgi:hypothetical protein
MKPVAQVLIILMLFACTGTGHYDADKFDLINLKIAVEQLFELPADGDDIEEKWWPSAIAELKPKSVRKNENGIYIELDSFYVEKSGLFIPSPGFKVETDVHYDPGYMLLGNGVYSYHATG